MQKLHEINEVEIGTLKTFTAKKERTVEELLKELKLSGKFFAVLVNGKRVDLTHKIKENDSVVLLPKIAGG